MRYVPVATTPLLLLALTAVGPSVAAPSGALPPVTAGADAGEMQDARWTVRPLNANCPQPTCVSWRDLNTLWASPDATLYVRCRPAPTGYWMMELNACAPGTLFQYSRQGCPGSPFELSRTQRAANVTPSAATSSINASSDTTVGREPSNCLVIINKQSHAVCALVGRPVPEPSGNIGAFGVIAICLTLVTVAGASGWYLVWRNPERRRWLYSTVDNSEVSSLLLNATMSESDDDMLI
uniref:Uncharacterized protein n=1 Tax=Anopheles atroparvus TaxID=41427 RepID=A0A182J283_ANOAO